jgi:predicted MFS family arabinose efflux permease
MTGGGFISLFPVVAAELFGLQKIATYIGMLIGSAGLGNLVGTPIATALSDGAGGYFWTIMYAGLMGVIGSLGALYLRVNRTKQWWAKV